MGRLLLIVLMLIGGTARAETRPALIFERAHLAGSVAHLRYEAHWGGLHAGDFILDLRSDGGIYAGRFDMRTRGIIDWLIRLKVIAQSQGPVTSPGHLAARDYRVDYTTRKRENWTAVHFDPAGGPAQARQGDGQRDDNEDDPEDRPHPVGADLRTGVVDPLAAFIDSIRRAALHIEQGGPKQFRIGVFDGIRRSDLEGVYLGVTGKSVLGHRYEKLHHLRLTTHAVAGFRKRHKVLWNDSAFDVWLTADGRYIPVQMDSLGAGPTCNLVEICESAEVCRFPKDE